MSDAIILAMISIAVIWAIIPNEADEIKKQIALGEIECKYKQRQVVCRNPKEEK